MKLETEKLKNILSVISNVIKYNNIKPITNFVELYSQDNILHIGATDNITTIVSTMESDGDIENIVMNLQDFYKLIKLTTKDIIELKKYKDYVELKGNGKYKIPIQLDEMGNEIQLPLRLIVHTNKQKYNKSQAEFIKKYNEFALCKDINYDFLSYYCMIEDYTISTNSVILAGSKNILPLDITPNIIVSHLCKLPYEEIEYSFSNNIFRISSDNYELQINVDITKKYPIDSVKNIIHKNGYDTIIENIDTKLFLNILKRLNIFQNSFDVPCVVFSDEKLHNKINTVEELLVGNIIKRGGINVIIKVETLIKVLKVMKDNVNLYLGKDMIKIEDSDVFYIISRMEE